MLERYIVSLVAATRDLSQWDTDWKDYLVAGASPRASIALLRAASAMAYMHGRDHVIPDDIIEIAPDVLRHRIILGYAGRADGVTQDAIIEHIVEKIPVP
jgi:MoxR-like ATPase